MINKTKFLYILNRTTDQVSYMPDAHCYEESDGHLELQSSFASKQLECAELILGESKFAFVESIEHIWMNNLKNQCFLLLFIFFYFGRAYRPIKNERLIFQLIETWIKINICVRRGQIGIIYLY